MESQEKISVEKKKNLKKKSSLIDDEKKKNIKKNQIPPVEKQKINKHGKNIKFIANH